MQTKIFSEKSQGGVFLSKKYYESAKHNKFRSLFDSVGDYTLIMTDIERATVNEAKDFYNYVTSILEEGKYNIIIDLESVYFIDSVFFGTMIKLLKRVNQELGFIKLIVDHKSKPELLSISNFEGIFDIYPNLFEAINELKAS
jgi:anti-anti-sigma factor